MTLIRNLKDGFYQPLVSDGAKTRFSAGRKDDDKISRELKKELSHDWENICDAV